jgi:hypothetical protein
MTIPNTANNTDEKAAREWLTNNKDAFEKMVVAAAYASPEHLKIFEPHLCQEKNRKGIQTWVDDFSKPPYQTVAIPGNPVKQKLLDDHCRHLVSRALELILTESTLNVRILTRSPLAKQDFALFKRFGNRLIFGMSIPTLDDELRKVYEPHAPGVQVRLKTLQAAAEAGIPTFVAMAPTYPECDEADLRRTLEAIRPLKPLTIFHEPINVRAENVARIAKHAAELNMQARMKPEVFANTTAWRRYAIDQLMTVQKIAHELGMEEHLHLWPDKSLKSKGPFMEARALLRTQSDRGQRVSACERERGREEDESAYLEFKTWLAHWHSRISEWPGKM